MRPTYLTWAPGITWRISVRKPEAEVWSPKQYPVQEFLQDFKDLGAKVKAPPVYTTGREYGIAGYLCKRYDRAKLIELATLFWRWHSQPLFDRPDLSALVLFKACITDIEGSI